MEEKLFWISLVSGGFALALKRALSRPGTLERRGPVAALNGLFWGFVGAAAAFLLVSYKELPTMTPWAAAASAAAGGLLGVLWALPTGAGSRALLPALWATQGSALAFAGGILLDAGPRTGWAMAGAALGGAAAGFLARTGSVQTARRSVAGLLTLEGALCGWWLGSVPGGAVSLVPLFVLAGLGFLLGTAWRPRVGWTQEGNATLLRETLEWADTGFSAILLAAAIMFFLVQAFKIPSGSMRMTLLEGDHLFVNKFIYGWRIPYTDRRVLRWNEVERGDIIVFRFPTGNRRSPHYGKDFIKRAVGLPGDEIEIRNKRVFVNGAPLGEERYVVFADEFVLPGPGHDPETVQSLWVQGRLGERDRDNFGPVRVPEGCYFVMGDNRDRSYDSRFWGPLPAPNLKGKAWVLYWPLSRRKVIR